jgi:hypothetical protein
MRSSSSRRFGSCVRLSCRARWFSWALASRSELTSPAVRLDMRESTIDSSSAMLSTITVASTTVMASQSLSAPPAAMQTLPSGKLAAAMPV